MNSHSVAFFAILTFIAGSVHAIGNGIEAMRGDVVARSVVDLRVGENRHCSATVLDKKLLLTATHCTFFYGESKVREAMNWELTAQQPNDGKIIKVRKVIRNTKGSETGEVSSSLDIAVIELESPLSDYFQPVKIAEKMPEPTEVLRIAGIGPNQNGGGFGIVRSGEIIFNETDNVGARTTSNPIVQEISEVGIYVFPTNRPWGSAYSISKTMDRAYICGGDSGGALFKIENNRMIQYGVISARTSKQTGSSCAEHYGDKQYFSAIFGENKIFVARSYYERLGRLLDIRIEPRETNPQYLEYNKTNYLKLPKKNQWIDLENYGINLAKSGSVAQIINLKNVRDCQPSSNDMIGFFNTQDIRQFDVVLLPNREILKAIGGTSFPYPLPVILPGWTVGTPTSPWIMLLTPDGYVAGPIGNKENCRK